MTPNPRWSIGPIRRFTRNLLLPATVAGHPIMLKYTRDPSEALAEIRGHQVLADHYRVPALHTHQRVPGGHLLLYERLPVGTDSGLLLDLLNQPGEPTNELRDYMTALTEAYRKAMSTTARLLHPRHIVRKLYWDRAQPGGRLDDYYLGRDYPFHGPLTVSELTNHTLIVNNRELHLDWHHTLTWIRDQFATDEPIWAALTQGDPTDVNLAYPLAWLDYDTAGMNSLPGEFANFLWYTTALGGWLVPTYNPTAFTDHPATLDQLPINRPKLHWLAIEPRTRTIRIDYSTTPAPARQAAANWYWKHLVEPTAADLWPGQDLGQLLRPYLVMRILAIYNVADLEARDRMIILARLAEAMDPGFNPITFFHLEETLCATP
ncbi:hypothetical protein E6W39_06215 [Kitasatospora acidiphila]|uniref:Aminoglycoside phosphotransferase domain-containing protein n=1 Tax=Kitasatospora acidiphila TaxID=2567942 RepID=A0A540VYY2_9ACTN|nr:hypothetical protein [Kitasatospora acidiphila]TQF01937.1 hypothetical protein E6W39_06215 [Kitasatospora acidiphila]